MFAIMIRWFLLTTTLAILGCTQKAKSRKETVKIYCGSCHALPEPALLDKASWKKSVLPAMGKLLGAQQLELHPFEESDRLISRQESLISPEEWNQIRKYYIENAPEKLPQQSRSLIKSTIDWFSVERKGAKKYPASTFIRIDPGNQCIYVATTDSTLQVYDNRLNELSSNLTGGILVDMFFTTDLQMPGERKGISTDIGIMDPNDLKTGSVTSFTLSNDAMRFGSKLLDTLPRPVQVISTDLDRDSLTDYLVCGFGNKEGNFSWIQNTGNKKFNEKVLEAFPGAIRACTEDMNNDGLQDIVVLFAQGNEGIRLFLNKGNGEFERIEILQFPPVYGSTYFELVDFDSDGKKDILYTCGDNADYSKVLKNYHGVYIFLNKGGYRFEKAYFFPLHGAFKAMAKDFNNDGRLDIAAISFFPDTINQPEEAFVLLEQKSRFEFIAHSIEEHGEGHWLTMDAADIDADGDDDIVIGSLLLPIEMLAAKAKNESKPLFLLLRNKTTGRK